MSRRTLPALLLALGALAACEPTRPAPTAVPAAAGDPLLARGEGRWLPYGVAVREDEEIGAPPEPYDARRHGPALRNADVGADLVRSRRLALPRRDAEQLRARARRASLALPTETPGTGDRGLWVNGGTGIYAGNDASTNLSIPTALVGTTIYAPTHMSAGGACLETVTAHYRYTGMATTVHGHGFWNWCDQAPSGWMLFEEMTTTWRAKYVRTLSGEARYFTMVAADAPTAPAGGCWTGYLYDFNAGRWEQKVRSCGTNTNLTGWTMWESYLVGTFTSCPTFPNVRATDVTYQAPDGSWRGLLTAGSTSQLGPDGRCWADGKYTFRTATSAAGTNGWQAFTPY